jgi:prepilin-type N-terminal cleavage/methylation domain-containing protein
MYFFKWLAIGKNLNSPLRGESKFDDQRERKILVGVNNSSYNNHPQPNPSPSRGMELVRSIKACFSLKTTSCGGYSLLEMLLAAAVGSIVLAGSYTSFVIIANQYQRVSAFSEVQAMGIPTIKLLQRDLRMAGRIFMDDDIEPVYGSIATPVTITDSGNACCDSISIIYDRDDSTDPLNIKSQRCQLDYTVSSRTTNSVTRNALYLTVTTLFTSDAVAYNCTGDGATTLVADYIDDLQFVGSDLDSNGNPMIVDVSMIVHSKNKMAKTVAYTKPTETIGNYSFTANDNYHRDEFTATVNIRNLR